ncbi:unnamed protein product [Hymenolepis diminuta]|uniref:Uncharacterized protein n=1 Tax=Hymenolepis diminuta TaxID=6216 RepID=A0A564Z8K0_HYMDI|nr:unnamed protein product [Hymenolepis diminuta]
MPIPSQFIPSTLLPLSLPASLTPSVPTSLHPCHPSLPFSSLFTPTLMVIPLYNHLQHCELVIIASPLISATITD